MLDTKAGSTSPVSQTMQLWSSLSVVFYGPMNKLLWNICLGVKLLKPKGIHEAIVFNFSCTDASSQPASGGWKTDPTLLPMSCPCSAGGRHVLSFPPKLCSLVKPWAYRLWLSRGYALFKFILWWTVFSKGTKVPSSLAEALGTWLHQVLLDGTPELLPYATFQGVPYSHPYQHAVVYLFINSHIVFTKCQILFSGPYKYWFI